MPLLKILLMTFGLLGWAGLAQADCSFQADSLNYGKCQKDQPAQNSQAQIDRQSCNATTTDSVMRGKCFPNPATNVAKSGKRWFLDSSNCQRGGCGSTGTFAH